MTLRLRRQALTGAAVLVLCCAASAATLRPFGTLAGPAVRVSDLWDDAGAVAGVVLGPAPGPGERIVVEAPQLLAIARQFGVDWRPDSGGERTILERPGVLLPQARVEAALRRWFAASGDAQDPARSSLALSGFVAPLVAADAAAEVSVEQCSLEPESGRFTASLAVTGQGMSAVRLSVSGRVIAMMDALLATRHVPGGSLLQPGDAAVAPVARERVRGPVATDMAQAQGMVLRRALAEGEPVLLADLAPPAIVAKGGRVVISIESAGVAATAIGEALQQGTQGERITVRNPASRAVLIAEVTGPGRVRVSPGSLPLRPPASDAAVSP